MMAGGILAFLGPTMRSLSATGTDALPSRRCLCPCRVNSFLLQLPLCPHCCISRWVPPTLHKHRYLSTHASVSLSLSPEGRAHASRQYIPCRYSFPMLPALTPNGPTPSTLQFGNPPRPRYCRPSSYSTHALYRTRACPRLHRHRPLLLRDSC